MCPHLGRFGAAKEPLTLTKQILVIATSHRLADENRCTTSG
jgi:hypothetical protein